MEYSFNIQEAVLYGVNEAIFMKNLKHWVLQNKANGINIHPVSEKEYPDLAGQKRYWTYNSIKAYKALFPFWTERQVRTAIEHLLKLGVILKGSYNQNPYDRTSWFALRDESILHIKEMDLTLKSNVDLSNKSNEFAQEVKCITDINTDVIPNENKETLTPFSNGKNKPKTKCEPQPIPTGLDTPDFVEAWAQLLETKKWRTKEASAVNLVLKKLSAYDVAFAIQLVETATMGGYQCVVFSDTPIAYEKWQKTKQTSSQIFQQPHPNFPSRPLYVNSFADKWAKVKWWRTNLAELENGQDKEYSFTEISKMLQYTEPLNILK